MAQDPGRVFPGKNMTGHMGAVKRTQQTLEIVRIDESAAVADPRRSPGSRGGDVWFARQYVPGVRRQSRRQSRSGEVGALSNGT